MVPLDGYPWLVLKAFTDLFIVACIGWLLIPALLQLLLRGLDTPAMLQILGAGVIWVLPLVFNIGVLYWHASINYAFIQPCAPQVAFLKRAAHSPQIADRIRHDLRGRYETVRSFRNILSTTMTPFFLLPEPRDPDFESYLRVPDQQETEVLTQFGNSVFFWVFFFLFEGLAGLIRGLWPQLMGKA